MPRLMPARHRIRAAWIASLLLALVFVSCWEVEADLYVYTHALDFDTTKDVREVVVRNDSEDNSLTSGVVTLQYKFTCDQPWVSVTPSSGSCGAMEKRAHTVTVDRSQMKFGENHATISITSNGGRDTVSVRAVRLEPGCASGPTAPVAVSPAPGATGVVSGAGLSWEGGKSQCPGLAATYDVYFGSTSPAPFDHNNDTLTVWNPGALANNTTYYWRIVVKDANGEVRSPQWTFQTVCDLGPGVVTLVSPADNATGVSVNDDLAWGGGVSQCAGLTSSYDVYFGTVSPPPFHHNQTTKYWDPGTLEKGTTYYWKIVAKDAHGTSASEERSFVTAPAACTTPATAVQLVAPLAEAKDVPLDQDLSWTGGDSQCAGLTATYDVYFGAVTPPPFHHNNGSAKTWDPGLLQYDTIYYWRIVAKDANGSVTSNEQWFRTPCHLPPGALTIVAPANGATNVTIDSDLFWGGGNSQCPGLTSTYDVYFGATSSPPLAASLDHTKNWDPGTLTKGVKYYWKIVAKDANGETAGPVWSFTTEPPPCTLPPTAACSPVPSNNRTNVNRDSNLSWSCGDSQCGNSVTYDVYLGTSETLGDAQRVATGITTKSWVLPRLNALTKYYWKVVTHDANGTASSPVWNFTTKS